MRIAYNNTQFQTDEEAITCNFLANNIASKEIPKIATDQVNYGYTKNIYSYLKNSFPTIFRPGEVEFLNVFNSTMDKREYVIYNTNLGKEIVENEMKQDQFSILFKRIMFNNKIYDCGQTFIINGRPS
jgi:hypothetical protein